MAARLALKLTTSVGGKEASGFGFGQISTNLFLRCLHNLALGLGWIPGAIIPPRLWPQPKRREKRAITLPEHELVLASGKNSERRDFFQLLWKIGSAQNDAAMLTAGHIDWPNRMLSYQRQKTGEWGWARRKECEPRSYPALAGRSTKQNGLEPNNQFAT